MSCNCKYLNICTLNLISKHNRNDSIFSFTFYYLLQKKYSMSDRTYLNKPRENWKLERYNVKDNLYLPNFNRNASAYMPEQLEINSLLNSSRNRTWAIPILYQNWTQPAYKQAYSYFPHYKRKTILIRLFPTSILCFLHLFSTSAFYI